MNKRIYLSSPHMGVKELDFVHEAFETNWVAPLGKNVDGFEQDLCNYTGVEYAAALTTGTAAIHLALVLLGVLAGDEVVCQSFTFAGSANPITYQGATPIFVDSESETWNMSPDFLQEAIRDRIRKGKKPKAIIYVHLYGMPAKIDEIHRIANEYEIPLIEDAAEALGSLYKNKQAGSFGDFGILSFNGNKIITTSGGGALLGNDKGSIEKARFLATQARDNAPHYQHSTIGYNYRMSNIVAGIGRGQMIVIDERVKQRRENYSFYKEELKNYECFSFVKEAENVKANRWLTTVLIDPKKSGGSTRDDVRIKLESENIESRPLWKPMHKQPVFRDAPYYGDTISESLFEKGLCLPSGSNMTDNDKQRIVEVIKTLF
ncbi:DegT/DnrJ/EryC1/StrS aminotransferase [Chloroherpeton thalassium ATCC 35110]|uniref:GDP-perosamine synthase n=1 Tax=Chloroherpeton thalassium (strain ATCC 35110 / GB-78) TaxID=517418 RepID=B3QVK5_CHLT3|nr:aminotransferase class I/II-fold pyridoxal phosphate-dependent enzyme [Chloroherpeton thalassium]ACF14605.1 DegT/DnrJ/EryC1/StrS aminotransferase [Chloroherpeton thalassium ATCC 35110]